MGRAPRLLRKTFGVIAVLAAICQVLCVLPAGASTARHELVFIENNVADYQALVSGVHPGAEVHVLDASRDGLAQMAEILRGRSGIAAIHVLSHGSEGKVQLGALTLAGQNLNDHASDLTAIGRALKREGDILLYGCNVAKGAKGAAFVSALAQATHAKVAASTDATGAQALGGNWVLEKQTGQIEADKAISDKVLLGYDGLLATNGTANGTYDFGGTIGANDSAGGGFATYSDKFVISNGMAVNDASSIWASSQTSLGTTGTFVVKAEGTTTCQTFTFKDFGISAYSSGQTIDALTITTKDASGTTIATHSLSGTYTFPDTGIHQASAIINGGTLFTRAVKFSSNLLDFNLNLLLERLNVSA